ncbi:helix-turn-helix domain-containing protein [Fodinibius sp. Rm-B-1B1-1]|uniref:helix-turn-helix domain-containing protein n=1 Tax=Fodinibius alkaliphilus TaxID=3140241 RepID=UPI0031599D4E
MSQPVQEENLKAIFGLKLRQYRELQELSTQELAKQSGLSASYINEIEKGKKYPKADKIMSLATALDVDYDEMVSLKLGKQLGQLSDLLKSNALHEMPLELFGIKTSDLIGLMGDDPAKFSALLQTLLEVARNYDVRVEHFLLAALRSYQELNNNYFEELEKAAESFLENKQWMDLPTIPYNQLKTLLETDYDYEIIESSFDSQPELQGFRSIYVPTESPKLFINDQLFPNQKAFVLGRELGYNILDLKERALTSSWIKVESFNQVLNNFKASYFSGAILMNRHTFVQKLQDFFNRDTWDSQPLLDMIDYFDTTPETFTHRLTQILPHYFGLDQLFFLRFHNMPGSQQYKLSKELHLSQLHNPHRVNPSEHYCRRWITITLLQKLADTDMHEASNQPLIDIQRSQFYGTENEYLCISFARPLALNEEANSCITLGLLDNNTLKKGVNFASDTDIKTRIVNESCERCPIPDCQERAAEPMISKKDQQQKKREKALQYFLEQHSE